MPEKRKPPYFKIFIAAMIVTAIVGGVFVWALSSKTSRSWGSDPANYVELHYVGLGLSESETLFGTIPVTVSAPLSQTYGDNSLLNVWQVFHLRKERVNNNSRHRRCSFEYIDATGKCRATGTGIVDFSGPGIMSVVLYKIDEATYFKADGSVGSKISGGDGRETWWNDDGSFFLKSVFENGYWVSTTFYDENGNVKEHAEYEEGKHVNWKRFNE